MKLIGLLVLLALVSLVEGEVVDQSKAAKGNPFGQSCAKYFHPDSTAPPAPPGYLNANTYIYICQRFESAEHAQERAEKRRKANAQAAAGEASERKSQRTSVLTSAATQQAQAAELAPARYATLYDTERKIPVYSAYLITGPDGKINYNRHTWMIEPQLDGQGNEAMSSETKGQVSQHQANDDDYDITNPAVTPHCYERGHLYPVSQTLDKLQADSTFTLTNTAPQWSQDNKKWYQDAESQVMNNIQTMCKIDKENPAYLVTGVIPSANNKLNNRVNIPSEYWTAFCCKKDNKWTSLGYRKEMNGRGNGKLHTYTDGVSKLNADLQKAYGNNNFKLFGQLPGCS